MLEEKEIWRDILGYEGFYKISNFGRVLSLIPHNGTSNRKLKNLLNKTGYYQVGLHINGSKKKMFLVHRLIANAFIPNPENKPCVNHINGKKTDNRIENLEWCTHSENTTHAFETKLKEAAKGEKHGKAVLTKQDVLEIRARLYIGEKAVELSKEFGVTPPVISKIKLRQIWTHI